MRMKACPHCGAQNSVRRTTCYQCQQALATTNTPAAASSETPRANSRWEAIGQETGRTQVSTPSATSPTAASAPADAPLRRYVPSRRNALKHVRAMGVFFRQLHAQTKAGIAIGPACRELERRAPTRFRPVARDMAAAADAGQPVSDALVSHTGLLYPWHLGVIKAAETGGFLPEAFEQIAHAYEVEWETRAAFRLQLFFYSTFALPAVLFVIPLLLTVQQPIPKEGWTPQTVIATVVHYARTVSLPIALGLIAIVICWQVLQSFAWVQAGQQRLVIRLPIVGRVARATALDRYLATLGLMLRGGLPIAQAAEEAALAAGNADLTPKLLDFVPHLREGIPLAGLLTGSRLFDADTLSMAATGEVSGALPEMLSRAADYYRADAEMKRHMLQKLAKAGLYLIWAAVAATLFFIGVRNYFDLAFRTQEWFLEGFQ